MTFPSQLLLATLLTFGGCINPRVELLEAEQSGDTTEPRWRELADRRLTFDAPKPLADFGAPPIALPSTSKRSPPSMLDDLPGAKAGSCSPEWMFASCARATLDTDGQPMWEIRVDTDGQTSVTSTTAPNGYWRLDRCLYDAHGRVVNQQTQATNRPDGECGDWDIITTRKGYDEHGELVFLENRPEKLRPDRTVARPDEDGTYVEVYQIVFEEGRPVRKTGYTASLDFSEAFVMWVHRYQWANGRLARLDSFDLQGKWDSSELYTWSGDLLRIDWFKPPTEGFSHTTEIHQRRGPGDYVQLYKSPNTHWEYSTENGIETVTKFAGELVVERRRFALAEGERRPLTVEQLVPERVGLVVVETWDWSSPDRVVVEHQDGRDVYLLDCSELPPIESLIDPDCPPPRPVR